MITSKYVGLVTKHGVAIIDSDQYPKLKGRKVFANTNKTKYSIYPVININKKRVPLANFIKNHNPKDSNGNLTVDHKNRNTWDNRDENLRIIDKTGQRINSAYSNNPYDYHGVYFSKPRTKNGTGYWIAFWMENKVMKRMYFPIGIDDYDTAFEKAVEYRLLIELFIPEYYENLCLFEKSDSFTLGDINNHPDITIIDQTKEMTGIDYHPPNKRKRAYYTATIYNKKTKKRKSKTFTVWDDSDDAKNKSLNWRKKKVLKYYKK